MSTTIESVVLILRKAIGWGILGGIVVNTVVLSVAFAYEKMTETVEWGWDAKHFFTHGAFVTLFGLGFAIGVTGKIVRSKAPTPS